MEKKRKRSKYIINYLHRNLVVVIFLFLPTLTSNKGSLAAVNGFFGTGVGPILLDNIGCTGNESHLLQCHGSQNLGVHQCNHRLQAGVICPGMLLKPTFFSTP